MDYRHPPFLRNHMRTILNFYHPRCMDHDVGGYINQFLDDGTIFDYNTKHLVGTCRFLYNYATAAQIFRDEEYQAAAAHGLHFLQEVHRQPDDSFAWVLQGRTVEDGTRHCYGHAFVLLAAASAIKAGVEGSEALMIELFDLLGSTLLGTNCTICTLMKLQRMNGMR